MASSDMHHDNSPEVMETFDVRKLDTSYYAMQIGSTPDHRFAVVGRPSGAIAIGTEGQLLMRLTKDEATRIALSMSSNPGKQVSIDDDQSRPD